jgi:hypothetical protein
VKARKELVPEEPVLKGTGVKGAGLKGPAKEVAAKSGT